MRRAPGFDMGEECFEMFAHQAIQGRFLRARLESRPDDSTDRNAEPELRSNPRGDAKEIQRTRHQKPPAEAGVCDSP